jgi:hypothetical protein
VAVVVGLAVVALGVATVTGVIAGVASPSLSSASMPVGFWLAALLAVLVDTKPFASGGRGDRAPVFPSVCYTFVILLAWGFGPAVLVQALAVAVSALWLRHATWRAVFNAANTCWPSPPRPGRCTSPGSRRAPRSTGARCRGW